MEELKKEEKEEIGKDKKIIMVDEEKKLLKRMESEMERRGFKVKKDEQVEEGIEEVKKYEKDYEVVEMRIGDGKGINIIEEIRQRSEDKRDIVIKGYGNIENEVNEVKIGEIEYMQKKEDEDEVLEEIKRRKGEKVEKKENKMYEERVRWENIKSVYEM